MSDTLNTQDVRITVRFGKSRLPVVLPVTHQLMRLLGLYAAEGTRLDATIYLSFGSHETNLIEETKRLIVQASLDFYRLMG